MIVHERMRGASSPIVAVVPDLPQPGERERLAVAAAEEPRLLALAALDRLPLVEAVGGTMQRRRSNARLNALLVSERLGAGVDHAVADREVLRPRRHQAPAHEVEHPLAVALGDDRHLGPGRHVVVGLELGVARRISVTSKRSARIVGEDTET